MICQCHTLSLCSCNIYTHSHTNSTCKNQPYSFHNILSLFFETWRVHQSLWRRRRSTTTTAPKSTHHHWHHCHLCSEETRRMTAVWSSPKRESSTYSPADPTVVLPWILSHWIMAIRMMKKLKKPIMLSLTLWLLEEFRLFVFRVLCVIMKCNYSNPLD